MKTLEMKRQEAAAADRAKERSTFTPEEQLTILDQRIGSSAKERARLQLAIAKSKEEKPS